MPQPSDKLRNDQAQVMLAEYLRKRFPEQDEARKRLEHLRTTPAQEGFEQAMRDDLEADQLKTLGDTLIAVALEQHDRNRDGWMSALEMHHAREFIKDRYETLKKTCPLPASPAKGAGFFACLSSYLHQK